MSASSLLAAALALAGTVALAASCAPEVVGTRSVTDAGAVPATDDAAAPTAKPFDAQPDESEGLTNVSANLDALLIDPDGTRGVLRDAGADARLVLEAIRRVAATTTDPTKELVVAGRASSTGLRWLERSTASRTRALVEERGFRTRAGGQRPVRSALGLVLDRDGPDALGPRLAELGDAAIVDTRVLIAHRFGADEASWPAPEDRFASDLLLADRIADPWLRALTTSARGYRERGHQAPAGGQTGTRTRAAIAPPTKESPSPIVVGDATSPRSSAGTTTKGPRAGSSRAIATPWALRRPVSASRSTSALVMPSPSA